MAALMLRMKWFIWRSIRPELFATIFIFAFIMTFILLVWETNQPVDGTFIDLSERHQMELIEEYKKEKELLAELKRRQKAIIQKEGKPDLDEDDAAFFNSHTGILKDAKIETSSFNLTKYLQTNPHVITQRKKHIGDDSNGQESKSSYVMKTPSAKRKTKEKYIKYYDPNQGKVVYKPVIVDDTELEGGLGHCHVYDLTSNLTEKYDCMELKVKPPTPICLYPDRMDVHISRHIREEGIWEPHIVHDFQKILRNNPDMAVVDIGANIGQYTLLAATMGHKVIAVEPYLENIKHLQKAAQMAGVESRITVIQNALHDTRKMWFLKLDPVNQGGVGLELENTNPDSGKPHLVDSMYMDDLLEVITFDKALIKIDIEGQEHRAFRYSSKFFKRVYVPYIFMEWMKLRQYHGSEMTHSENKLLTHNLVVYLHELGYSAFSSVTQEKLDPEWWVAWTDDIIWKHNSTSM